LLNLLPGTKATIAAEKVRLRTVLSLDGTWEIAEGCLAEPPSNFDRRVPVPGLVDLATPPFDSPGSTVPPAERRQRRRPADPRREAFWYRRTFTVDGAVPPVARLKINKACYGTKVILNGQDVGEHEPNWTPGWFDVAHVLRGHGQTNELLVRVGASLAQVPPFLTEGWDFEKSRYIPGIYDSVSLILSGEPHIVNVQAVPDVDAKAVRAVVELASPTSEPLTAVVREAVSGRVVGEASVLPGQAQRVEITVPIREARLWTPEDPFLYQLSVRTSGDEIQARFGLRSFRTDPARGCFLLNGRPYFLRGSNVCIFRFFEDPCRGHLPWDREWVRRLHRRFKQMHWNALRYCIGFPPELWYEIADEEGILIQDEFPIWYGTAPWPEEITAEHLTWEFTEWLRERWNHPCVVIWDAQNETTDDTVLAAAIKAVRHLDLSGRPWDNGWGAPQEPGDISETHPYRANRKDFSLALFAQETGIPDNGPGTGRRPPVNLGRPPYLINEYGWLWINRDGTLPTLTVDVYERLLGADATVAERRYFYARTLAAMTEFWRARRKAAGVLHFCGLGYSRPDGQTSDNFVDVVNLIFEPNFFQLVRDAFHPLGIMVDYWEEFPLPGQRQTVSVQLTSDLDCPWAGTVRLALLRGEKLLWDESRPAEVPPWGTAVLSFEVKIPEEPGRYTFLAQRWTAGEQPVASLRDFTILSSEEKLARDGLAVGKRVLASSHLTRDGASTPEAVADGNPKTRWSSEFSDPQWITIDLEQPVTISRVELLWETAYARAYSLEVSLDGINWQQVFSTDDGKGGREVIRFAPVQVRYVRMTGTRRATPFGYSLWEFRVFP
jgi:hypothetical protein